MLRHGCLLLMLVLVGVAGCGGQSSPDVEPQNANQPARGGDKKRVEGPRTDGKPKAELVKVFFLRKGPARQVIKGVLIAGDPAEKDKLSGYQFKNIKAVEGAPAKAGTYFLRDNKTTIQGSVRDTVEISTETDDGPFFDRKLPSGTSLNNAVWMGTCKADVQGWTREDANAVQKGLRFQLYEASYEKR